MSEINNTKKLPEGIFPINLKLIDQYQQKDPSQEAKYKMGAYQKGCICGVSNINLNLITCDDDIFIMSILQSCLFYW